MLRGGWEPAGAERLAQEAARVATPLAADEDLDPLMERVGDARVVLLGEASHGTSEFYTWRARLTQRLVEEKGFTLVAVEGDWPDCWEVNRFVRGLAHHDKDATEVLQTFHRWPTWMWANEEVAELADWMRLRNRRHRDEDRVGFYGLDVYSLWESMEAVAAYLRAHDPDALPAATRAFECFDPYGRDEQDYARATVWVPTSCEREVVGLLRTLREREAPAGATEEERFDAEQNALVAQNAERYYRAMVRGGAQSWNVRDRHMVETLDRLMEHEGPDAKAVVWEHNTHVGDARATDMAGEGMVNVGQLVRESRAPDDVVAVGFASHRGSVVAGRAWGAPMERMPVPPGREGSWESVLHQADRGDALLLLDRFEGVDAAWEARGHRAIGVVYDPRREAWGNYVPSVLPERYDALMFLDESRALRPLRPLVDWEETPETYPWGV